MISLPGEKALKLWQTFWDEAQLEFFKVESLQDYGGEDKTDPSYAAWLNGDPERSLSLIQQGSSEWTKQTKEKPILKRRVHITKNPLTPYLEWEILHYQHVNIPLGDERVFLVPFEKLEGIKLLGDFMIFDNERVADSHYDKTGRLTGIDFYEKDEDINRYLNLKEVLLSKATELKAA